MRLLYILGFSYIGLCISALILSILTPQTQSVEPQRVPLTSVESEAPVSSANEWFRSVKPSCNAVEVTTKLRDFPPPGTTEGSGYAAACYALAGRVDKSKEIIDALPRNLQPTAAGVVFEIGHPVADAGDNRSAAPIMRLVLEYWPENYMALYHAGIAEYELGDSTQATQHLQAFLEMYQNEDGWRQNAKAALNGIKTGVKPNLLKLE
ncbi:MAG: hypothetical protein NVS2B14_05090 [Chamaesiphon sp.]